MTKTEQLSQHATLLWTAKDLERLFRVTPMTISNWRKDPPSGRVPLPTVMFPGEARPTVRFVPEDVIAWAKECGVQMYDAQRPRERMRRRPRYRVAA